MDTDHAVTAATTLLEQLVPSTELTRDGLTDTPRRVVKAYTEMLDGYNTDIGSLLAVRFDEHHDELVAVTGIDFTSLCEHHLLPFIGTATVAYIPDGTGVVGLSKLARLVDAYAHRLQVQERLTGQIASALVEHVTPDAGVIITAHHECMSCRGVRKSTAMMVTSAMRGAFHDDTATRTELLTLHTTSLH